MKEYLLSFTENPSAQLIGLAALVLVFLSFQQKTHKKIMLFQVFSTLIFTLHFYLLASYTGAVLNLISAARSITYTNQKLRKNNFVTALFCVVFALSTFFTYEGPISFLAFAGCITLTLVLRCDSPAIVRRFSGLSSVFWIIYNVLSSSAAGIITEVTVLISIIIGIIRLDIKKRHHIS